MKILPTLRAWFAVAPLWASAVMAAPAAPLQVQVYNAPATSFYANAVVVTGATEAVVIDTGFSKADALHIAATVLDSGKTLTAIVISNADPDFYFGTGELTAIFPKAKLLASAAVRDKIAATMAAKVAYWQPKLGANAPRAPVLPDVLPDNQWLVDGQVIEIRGTQGPLAHRPYTYIPSLGAIVGNIAIFNQLHVWTADTQSQAQLAAWQAQLTELAALKPRLVVPGHMLPGSRQDVSAIAYTQGYLRDYIAAASHAKRSAELIHAMQLAYPTAGLGIALEIGAKVSTGEMTW